MGNDKWWVIQITGTYKSSDIDFTYVNGDQMKETDKLCALYVPNLKLIIN